VWHDGHMSDLVRVYASGDRFAADLMVTRLEAEGITALVKGGSEDMAYPAGPAYVFVSDEDEARARAVVDAVESGAFEVSDEDLQEPAGDEA
jgi:Putative prokaryotic signal transducing protein